MIEVQGHRGMRGLWPENTLPGFEAAIAVGVDVLEFDIQVTRDGELVLHHDYFIDQNRALFLDGSPLSDSPLVRSLTLAEIKRYDVGRKKNPQFPSQIAVPGAQIPTLWELFDLLQVHPSSKSVRLNLEIKRDSHHPEWTEELSVLVRKILSQVKQSRFVSKVYYSSFDLDVLKEIRKLDSQAPIGFIFKNPEFILKTAVALHVNVLSPEHSYLQDKKQVRLMQRMGFRVVPWTVNEPTRWAELVEMGVDGIITDYPQELIQFLN